MTFCLLVRVFCRYELVSVPSQCTEVCLFPLLQAALQCWGLVLLQISRPER